MSSIYNLHQLINIPTHILPKLESCIDLLSQPNLISETSVPTSVFPRYHQQIIYTDVNLNIFYPLTYERMVGDYSKANITSIKNRPSGINFDNSLTDLNVNDKVS